MNQINVAVIGAFGKMGSEVCKMIESEQTFNFVCIIDPKLRSWKEVPVFSSLEAAYNEVSIHVLVDFTSPLVVKETILEALRLGIRPVVGTTGLNQDDIVEVEKLCQQYGIGALVAPNFALGAVLMMKFAEMAAAFMPHVEIIELHHDQKIDAPSGTALKTAELIAQSRQELKQGLDKEKEVLEGARGGYYNGFRIHSVRLPGLVAHQEVIFGGEGETLTIRHDSIHRSSFMPGVHLGIKKVMEINHLVYGLENVLDLK